MTRLRIVKPYRDGRDWWVGYYRGDTHHYVCPLPTIVLRWRRRRPDGAACPIFTDGHHRWFHGRCVGCDRPAGATR